MSFLAAEQLSVSFGRLTALDGVSFDVERGQLVAVIGPNGAGKTTLFNAIAGAVRPARRRAVLDGRVVSGRPPHRNALAGVARTFQVARPFHELTVRDNVLVGLGRARYYRLGGLLRRARSSADIERAEAILGDVGLGESMERLAGELPLGHLRLLEIARALALSPRLLMLDEPAAGLRDTEEAALEALLRRLREQGLTMLLVEHDVEFALRVADRAVVLTAGRKLAEGAPEEVRTNPEVIDAYLGTGTEAGDATR